MNITIEFSEVFHSDGAISARLVCADLPKGADARDYTYRIYRNPAGWCETTSRSFGKGSIRYGRAQSYEAAQQAAIKWAERKIAEARRAA